MRPTVYAIRWPMHIDIRGQSAIGTAFIGSRIFYRTYTDRTFEKTKKKNRLELCKPIDSNTFNSYCADDDAIERVCGKID